MKADARRMLTNPAETAVGYVTHVEGMSISMHVKNYVTGHIAQRQRKPNQRSQQFKQANEGKKLEKANSSRLPASTVETAPRDELCTILGRTVGQDVHTQNFDFGGFIPIVEETYEKMRGIDPRLAERLPLSMFTHVATNHLNLQVAEQARQNGQNILNDRTDFKEVLSDFQCMPKSITDYISDVSNVLTQTGVDLKLNLPEFAIPQGPIGNVPSGSFGEINAQTHNVYETYIWPLVTANSPSQPAE